MAAQHMHMDEGHALFWLVVIFLVVYLLLTFFNPEYVQREDEHGEKNGRNDQALTMLWALGIVVIVVLAFMLLHYVMACAM